MDFPPPMIGFSEVHRNLSKFWRSVRQAFGHAWKALPDISWPLFSLILLVKKMADTYLASTTEQGLNESANRDNPIRRLPKNPFMLWRKEGLDSSAQSLFDGNRTDKQGISVPRETVVISKSERDDDLDSMGERDLQINNKISNLSAVAITGKITNTEFETSGKNENEILAVLHETIGQLKKFIKAISENKPKTLQDYLENTKRLEEEFAVLKTYASETETTCVEGHKLAQKALKALEDKIDELIVEMCMLVRRHCKPNTRIRSDGHCLFWSIEDLLQNTKGPQYYRKLAADYIREHSQDFESEIKDALKSEQVISEMIDYQKTQGGKRAWSKKLEIALGRNPTSVDLYCDCLEKSTLWGGTIEIFALSECLKVPILVFTRQNGTTWRFDMERGLAKFGDKLPMLLYYNGINHYQSLNERQAIVG